jgi:hypothetical protein
VFFSVEMKLTHHVGPPDGMSHGTIVAIVASMEKIAIASDSRGTDESGNISDDQCKVTELGGQSLFAFSGLDVKREPRACDLAKMAVHARASVSIGRLPSTEEAAWIGNDWGSRIRSALLELTIQRVVANIESDTVTQGFFAVRGIAGILQLAEARLTYDKASNDISVGSWAIPLTQEVKMYGSGLTAVFQEFITERKTPRARCECDNWKRLVFDPAEYHARLADWIVALTLKYEERKTEIGGPVDIAELSVNSPVHWIRRKESCR